MLVGFLIGTVISRHRDWVKFAITFELGHETSRGNKQSIDESPNPDVESE